MDSNFVFVGVAVAGMSRALRVVAPSPAAAPHAAAAGIPARVMGIHAAIPAQRKRRAATAATRTSVKRGTT
ncbi:hypothetical protein NIIDNTM18_14830 [Mycolicibacterium litorale]|uniref:Uncharacterized protein n=1 Tax=Mycolicibacterium litorale TaxID=758802 RepID=A0A6S6P1C2_9MYCO|nr:hypothetical protein [Mycolicibacterium litorale]BCI52205.1 hypothetical protein NIIDNTM18_14830 [Mycolicibacterium litorale]